MAAIAAALIFFRAGSPLAGKSATKTHVVKIQGMTFTPPRLQISPGDSVTWTNDDIVPHAVKSTGVKNAWESKPLLPHDSWTKVFNEDAAYLCPYHPVMTGEITLGKAPALGN